MSALRKVLVVDDDPVVGKSFNRVLSDKGYIVTTAQNAHEALDQLRQAEFDVVYTDIKMPGMDGLELAERVKAQRPWTPVVIITGFGTTANEARAKTAGVSAFLQKPLSPEMIESSAVEALQVLAQEAPVPVDGAAPVAALPEAPLPTPQTGRFVGAKTIAMLVMGPFIGLLFAVLLPFAGTAALAWFGGKALLRNAKARIFLKNVALFIAAPFVGLFYVVLFPFVGMAMLASTAVKALVTKVRAQ